jgi:small subunit ribosomal protein S7
LALRWLKEYSSARSGKSMVEKLGEEIIEASENRGSSIKKKEDVYKMAEANKAFSHLNW